MFSLSRCGNRNTTNAVYLVFFVAFAGYIDRLADERMAIICEGVSLIMQS
jgi:hypothetical protein